MSWHYVKLNAEVKFDMPVTGAGSAGKKESKAFVEDAYPISVKLTHETLGCALNG